MSPCCACARLAHQRYEACATQYSTVLDTVRMRITLCCALLVPCQDVALLTDGRFSGGSHGFVVGHICPESQVRVL